MGFAIELNLDGVIAAQILALWQTMAQARVSDRLLRTQAKPLGNSYRQNQLERP